MGSGSGRFFGWVIGGTLPVALAADWLTSTWDQNAASNLTAPAEAVVEQVCGEWAKEMFGLPEVGLVRLRHRLPDGAHDGARRGAPQAAARSRLGRRGQGPLRRAAAAHPDDREPPRIDPALGAAARRRHRRHRATCGPTMRAASTCARSSRRCARPADAPTVVCLQAGDLNTGVFDPFEPACRVGARGQGVGACRRRVRPVGGGERAASPSAGRRRARRLLGDRRPQVAEPAVRFGPGVRARRRGASRLVRAGHQLLRADRGRCATRRTGTRNGRAAAAAFRSMPRCARSAAPASPTWSTAAAAMPSAWCARSARSTAPRSWRRRSSTRAWCASSAPDGDHDRFTDTVIRRIQEDGVAWFGGVTWRGRRACASRSATG